MNLYLSGDIEQHHRVFFPVADLRSSPAKYPSQMPASIHVRFICRPPPDVFRAVPIRDFFVKQKAFATYWRVLINSFVFVGKSRVLSNVCKRLMGSRCY